MRKRFPTAFAITSSMLFIVSLIYVSTDMAGELGVERGGGGSATVEHERIVNVDAAMRYSVSGGDDIRRMRRYFQGASWETPILPETWQRLQPLGITRVRLINVESRRSLIKQSEAEATAFDFSKLRTALDDCRKYRLLPHVVVGQLMPAGLSNGSGDRGAGGVFESRAYKAYAYALLRFVVVDQGFSSGTFEVGNEPDTTGAGWLLQQQQQNGSLAAYKAYFQIYTAWAHAASRLSHEYPAATFRLGGPAITPYTLAYGQVDWAKQFAKDVAGNKLRLDFFSFHSYGDQEALPGAQAFGPYPPFAQRVKYYRTLLASVGLAHVPLYVTEWGASADVGASDAEPINGNEVGAAWSARFLLAMAEQRIDDGMLLVLRDEFAARGRGENWAWPAFLLSDGLTPKPLYNTALMFSKMAAQRVRVSGDDPTARVIASVDGSRVTMIVVKSDWDFQSKTDKAQLERLTLIVHHLPFPAGNVRVSRYLIDSTHSNPYTHRLANQPLDDARAGFTQVDVSNVPVVAGTVILPAISIPRSSVTFIEIPDIK
ncbi:hypothetical protein GNZ12_03280 [Paraburkholderia sp. 1N]|uniref:Glycosyl hydrolases family 39 N-terminal catalytic domain-containing protein n=1 Tax=Paraburkholderia solitsugae TaxID=2675748 RepID=A0ABX2BJK6_9BURK|nr:hypothetical protein [Paraburkholderia solitsugae]NPT40351.1 hypothetical protein [Paraburkholderia solitsugae]